MAPLRRLAAILSLDVEGYSSLVEADEAAALGAVARAYRTLVLPTIGDFGGEVFKTNGDGLLMEFASAVNAVKWAARFQRSLLADHPDDEQPLSVRIGVVIGDVVVTETDRFGEGIILATRVQELAPAGGVAISRGVFEYLRGKTNLYFTDIGPCRVKGFSEQERIWIWTPKVVSASRGRTIAVPDPRTQPSVAVMPFENLSGDVDRANFIDGMVEEVTASLSRVREFLVIARQSAAAYRDTPLGTREIAAELGVRYILQGSVRFSNARMRVSLHLVDGETALQIWSERIDAKIDDLFAVQDHIAEIVSGALHPTIRQAEVERARRKPPDNLLAYDLVMRALPHLWAHRHEENERAIVLIDEALALEPDYGRAAAIGAWAHAQHIAYNWVTTIAEQRARGRTLLERTLGRIDDDPLALTASATATMLIEADIERANTLIDRALDLDVNHAWHGRGAALPGSIPASPTTPSPVSNARCGSRRWTPSPSIRSSASAWPISHPASPRRRPAGHGEPWLKSPEWRGRTATLPRFWEPMGVSRRPARRWPPSCRRVPAQR
ncbi:adenylate/guanylate cyclase domain-containing protein [Aurantimonas sp. A2-1-M11]|uniref:adenylate/guanylate cyclase domain-containing protein n=1 Tax=Aurantimonas sp. A2-1-M11 TaxID=3113712 RepID=UPI002F92D349